MRRKKTDTEIDRRSPPFSRAAAPIQWTPINATCPTSPRFCAATRSLSPGHSWAAPEQTPPLCAGSSSSHRAPPTRSPGRIGPIS